MPKPAVIVVNSHVARGSVGGRASVFALERMGFPVWSVPTVTLPWHLGHGRATRVAVDSTLFADFLADLSNAPWLGEVGAVLTGYLGGSDQVAPIARLIETLKERNPSALFLCDPIVGDSDGLFQPAEVASAIRDRLVPLADIASPNRYELAWLAGRGLDDNAALAEAAQKLGPREVIVTSAFAPPGEIGTLVVTADAAHCATHRLLPSAPHGTGDLFAALYLGHRLGGLAVADALARACSSVLALIELAAETRTDEMPLAAGQDAFLAAPTGVTVTRLV